MFGSFNIISEALRAEEEEEQQLNRRWAAKASLGGVKHLTSIYKPISDKVLAERFGTVSTDSTKLKTTPTDADIIDLALDLFEEENDNFPERRISVLTISKV